MEQRIRRPSSPRSRALTRREVLSAGLVAAGGLLAACAPKAATVAPAATTAATAAPAATKAATTAPAATKAPTVVAKPTPLAAGKQITIQYWCGGGQARMDFYNKEVIPKFKDLYPNVNVELGEVPSWADLYNKLVTSAAGGAPPELCRQKDYFTPDFAVRGVQMDLTEYIAITPHLQDKSIWVPKAWEIAHYKGKPYALPINIFIHYPHYAVDLFEKAGLLGSDGKPKPIDTWEDWAATAKKLSDPANKVYGTMLRSENVSEDTTNFFHVLLAQAGGRLHDEQFTKFTFNTPEGLDVLNFIVGMLKDGGMKPIGTSITNTYSNQVGIWFESANYWTNYAKGFRWCVSVNPKRKTRGAVLRGNHLALYTASKNRDAGWAFMAFHETPDIDYAYGKSQNFITAQVANHKKEYYQGGVGGCAKFATEFEVLADPGVQNQPIRPGYQEASLKIAAQLQLAYMGKISPQEALATAEKEANQVLADTDKLLGIK